MSDTVQVWVSRVTYTGGTLAFAHGFAGGDAVTFAGSPRELHAIAEAIESEQEPVLALVPSWAILDRGLALDARLDAMEATMDRLEQHYFG